jgi:hypothetical protein
MTQPTDAPFNPYDGSAVPTPPAPALPTSGALTPAQAPVGYPQPSAPVAYPQAAYPQAGPGYPPHQAPVAQRSGLYLAAAIINWVVLGIVVISTLGFGIVAAAWIVPMTILTHKAAKDGYKHTGLAVCTLLFCGLVSGILMLVDEGNRAPKPVR